MSSGQLTNRLLGMTAATTQHQCMLLLWSVLWKSMLWVEWLHLW